MKKLIWALVVSFAVLSTGVAVAEPTVKEIYQTAQVNKQQALTMVNEVIKNRPNSARAHYIRSELLLQLGNRSEAQVAFSRAESLDPGLSFAKPESVERLRTALGVKKSWTGLGGDTDRVILLACGGLLIVLLVIFMLKRRPRTPEYSQSYNLQNRPITPYTPTTNTAPAPNQPPGSGPASAAPATGGSGLMGSLAQGAAMGVGVAAGATLANHLLNGNKASAAPAEAPAPQPSYVPTYTPDQDFGITDSGSDWGGDSGSGDDSNW